MGLLLEQRWFQIAVAAAALGPTLLILVLGKTRLYWLPATAVIGLGGFALIRSSVHDDNVVLDTFAQLPTRMNLIVAAVVLVWGVAWLLVSARVRRHHRTDRPRAVDAPPVDGRDPSRT